MSSIFFLAGAALAAASLFLKPLPVRVIALGIGCSCFAFGGAEIGSHNASFAKEKAAREGAIERAAERQADLNLQASPGSPAGTL